MFKRIIVELKNHAPFTFFGAVLGAVLMLFLSKCPYKVSYTAFYIFHPIHVVLSALVTASMYKIHKCKQIGVDCIKGKCNFWVLFIIGYMGAIGIATLSDSIIPYLGETLLNMPNREVHVGFIEAWWAVTPLAFIGVSIAYFRPSTKFPHAGHIMLSVAASLFHVLMAIGESVSLFAYVVIILFLFLSVWIPCCVSDIVFPLLFVKDKK